MKTGFFATASFALVLAGLLAGCAVDPEARLHVTAMASLIDDDPARNVDDDLSGFQVGVGKSYGDNYKLELAVVGSKFNADGFDADQRQVGIGLDIMRKLGSSEYFYPYAVLGLGHLRTNRLSPDFERDYNGPMISAGIGVITPFYVLGQAIRAELRIRNDSGDTAGERYQDTLLSIGLHFPLGQPATIRADSDGDGIDDSRDRCERTRPGAQVDKFGCARDLDSDGDGISDAIDMCGGTKAGRDVDEYGCERDGDSDNDGVPDYRDRCPGTRSGLRVDSAGCPDKTTAILPKRQAVDLSPKRTPATLVAVTQQPLRQAAKSGKWTQAASAANQAQPLTMAAPTDVSMFSLSYALSAPRPGGLQTDIAQRSARR